MTTRKKELHNEIEILVADTGSERSTILRSGSTHVRDGIQCRWLISYLPVSYTHLDVYKRQTVRLLQQIHYKYPLIHT